MAGDEADAAAAELVRDRDRLARVAGIVADLERDLAAHDAALGVEVGHDLLGAGLHLGAERGLLACNTRLRKS
jgi:hypothetical protein